VGKWRLGVDGDHRSAATFVDQPDAADQCADAGGVEVAVLPLGEGLAVPVDPVTDRTDGTWRTVAASRNLLPVTVPAAPRKCSEAFLVTASASLGSLPHVRADGPRPTM
jgi:hypothetical protein